MLGNGRLEAQCFDGEKRLAHIRGKMRKKVRILDKKLLRPMLIPRFPPGLDQPGRHHSALAP